MDRILMRLSSFINAVSIAIAPNWQLRAITIVLLLLSFTKSEGGVIRDDNPPEPNPPPYIPPLGGLRGEETIYRKRELKHLKSILLADDCVLVLGESGSGKTYLMESLARQLTSEGWKVAVLQPSSPLRFLKSLAQQIGQPTVTLEGKQMNMEDLREAIADKMDELRSTSEIVFLIVDSGERLRIDQRYFFKQLVERGHNVAIFATEVALSDLYLVMPPPMRLEPLPDYCIRDLMEKTAIAKGVNLQTSNLSKLMAFAGGNPLKAIRAVKGEYVKLTAEQTPTGRYLDLTPFLLLAGLVFVAYRYIGMGTGDPAQYIQGAIGYSAVITAIRIMSNIPRTKNKLGGAQ